MRAAFRTKAKAGVREAGIEDRGQYLEQGLLDQAVQHRRDAQHPHAFPIGLGYLYLPHRLGDVRAAEQLPPDAWPVLTTEVGQIIDAHAVNARRSLVRTDTLIRCEQVFSLHHLLDQNRRKVPGCSRMYRACLTPQVRGMGDSVACSAGWGGHLSLLAASISRREHVGPVRAKRLALHPMDLSTWCGTTTASADFCRSVITPCNVT